jgi:predicted DsbA family dithiol-disulfide isomerase
VLRSLAGECGLSDAQVEQAWSDPRIARQLQEHLAAAGQYQVRATPTVFFSEQHRLDGAMPYAQFLAAAQAGLALQQMQAKR